MMTVMTFIMSRTFSAVHLRFSFQVLLLNANNKRNNCYQNCMKLYMRTNIKNKQRTPLLRDGRPF